MYKCVKIVFLGVLFWGVSGCSTKPVLTPSLVQAQKEYEQLKKNEQMGKNGSLALFQAGKLYDLSHQAKSKEEANHLAYLLSHENEVVKESAKKDSLEAQIDSLKKEKEKALLDAKEVEEIKLQKERERRQREAKRQWLEQIHATESERGVIVNVNSTYFKPTTAALDEKVVPLLQRVADFLKANENRKVVLEGYLVDVGSPTFNLDLALRRAQMVKDALVEMGINKSRLIVRTHGLSDAEQSVPQKVRKNGVDIVILKDLQEHL